MSINKEEKRNFRILFRKSKDPEDFTSYIVYSKIKCQTNFDWSSSMLIKVIILHYSRQNSFKEQPKNSLAKRNFVEAINLYSRKNSVFQLSSQLLMDSQEKMSHSCQLTLTLLVSFNARKNLLISFVSVEAWGYI